MRKIVHLVTALVILGGGFLAFNTLKSCESNIFSGKELTDNKEGKGDRKKRSAKPPAIKTQVIPLEKGDFTVEIQSQGEVRAHHNTSLTAEVSGRILKISPKFEDGAFFKDGEILVELETADYLTEIESANAQLARAEAAFAQEEVRVKQALLNWKDAGFTEEPSDLVLRKPQLREAKANVTSAKSNLARAKRNLARTKVRAPYNGRVRMRSVGIGQQVGSNTSLGEIFTTDIAIVRLPITPRDLEFYSPPNKPLELAKPAKNITFSSIVATHGEAKKWQGRIIRAEGALDEDSRQIFVIARIEDPFGLKSNKPALYLGQPVRATIPAEVIKDVYTIPRSALSDLNKIIVIREGRIKQLDIKPIWSTQDHIIFNNNILPGDQLSITRMPYVPEGAPVEIMSNETAEQDKKAGQKVGSKTPFK